MIQTLTHYLWIIIEYIVKQVWNFIIYLATGDNGGIEWNTVSALFIVVLLLIWWKQSKHQVIMVDDDEEDNKYGKRIRRLKRNGKG